MSKNTHDPMKSYLNDRQILEKNDSLKADLELHKKAAEDAEKKFKASSKANRDAARAQARRDQFIGEVYMALAVDNPPMWMEFRPSLDAALDVAGDDLRALFGLEPKPKTDTEEASKAAGTVASNGKKEGQEATVEPPVEPAQPGDPRAESHQSS